MRLDKFAPVVNMPQMGSPRRTSTLGKGVLRMRTARELLLPILAAVIAFSLAVCTQQEEIRFGTAGVGGNYYEFGQTYAEKVAPDAGVTFDV